MSIKNQILLSIPHAGEQIPDQCPWLKGLPEAVLFCDVDRYVDKMYAPALRALDLQSVVAPWHRYAADLNRFPDDVDAGSVQGHSNPIGKFARGFHWQHTTQKDILMKAAMSIQDHEILVRLIHNPFHEELQAAAQKIKAKGVQDVYHLDLHSMPSLGTSEHKDPGERRADIVVSDNLGRSARSEFVNLVITSYVRAGFKVGYNWPYVGGRVTERYGRPDLQHHCVQVEMNRSLYMDEVTKQMLPVSGLTQKKLQKALELISSANL